MSNEIEEEAPRPRPLSGGIWTLFSWLRRTDRSSSSESISSVGSDRTVASFDFLAPLQYKGNTTVFISQSPETETYKKRLNERNLRRKYDRDITLRRKYGLYREEGFDGFSLPAAKRIQRYSPTRRDRRATSEFFQRRAPYVPGKRRAPLPPQNIVSNTLPRSNKRKRQAPKPPLKLTEENKENVNINKNIQMESRSTSTKYTITSLPVPSHHIQENCLKDNPSKDVKLRPEKSFLKQIFDNRKRNSAIDTSHVKFLPSISELDKQAAEIIATNKFIHGENSGHSGIGDISKLTIPSLSNEKMWICKLCFRKYDASIVSCLYCIKSDSNRKIASNIYTQTDNNVATSSRDVEFDEKTNLKKMLKEMKDSLPKRPKHNEKNLNKDKIIVSSTETPTLRIGAPIENIDGSVQKMPVAEFSKYEDKPENRPRNKTMNINSQPSTSNQNTNGVFDHSSKETNKINNVDEKKNDNANPQTSILNSKKYNFLLGPNDLGLLSVNSKNKVLNDNKTVKLNEIRTSGDTEPTIGKQPGSSGQQSPNFKSSNEIKMPSNTKSTSSKTNDENVINPYKNIKQTTNQNLNQSVKNVQNKSNVKITPKINLSTPTPHSTELLKKKSDLVKETKMERLRLGDVILPDNINLGDKNKVLNTPLRISSLLNPLYCPRIEPPTRTIVEENLQTKPDNSCKNKDVINNNLSSDISAASTSKSDTAIHEANDSKKSDDNLLLHNKVNSEIPAVNCSSNINNLNLHTKRRDLINQLESAISKGDEKTAAEAAANLAKLKLSCSVLSFSSQIVGLLNNNKPNNANKVENHNQESKNANAIESNDKHKEEVKNQNNNLMTITELTTETKSQPSTSNTVEDMVPIKIWVEDKEAARGPIQMQIKRKAVMGDLKLQAATTLGLEIRLQRWIIGKNLCTNDDTPLVTLAGLDFNAPFYLCLVESGTNKDGASKINEVSDKSNKNVPNAIKRQELGDVYLELMKLEQQALVLNTEEFECGVCIEQCAIGYGAVLRECIHTFCRECLSDVVRHCEEANVSCPAIGCPGTLQEREIRALLSPEDYDRWLARSLTAVESGTPNTFHCRTRDCTGWAFCEPGVRRFPCPVCKHTNCLPCQAVHENETCEQHQAKLRKAAMVTEANQTDEGTQALLESLIARGEALECPECSAIITKKWGCDWIKCSSCKTEICWVTKGRRWGPGGKGDTSGGCRCGVDGKRCHPSCGYCH